jgi:hypothetical protein
MVIIKVMLKAAEGKTISLNADGTTADLTIPPGALLQDTEIMARISAPASVPEPGLIDGKTYDLGPAGLEFVAGKWADLPSRTTQVIRPSITDRRTGSLGTARP